MAFDYHAQHNNAASATALTEAHNNYVQQLHAANGMIDQYYKETLPQLLQVSSNSNKKFKIFLKKLTKIKKWGIKFEKKIEKIFLESLWRFCATVAILRYFLALLKNFWP